MNIIVRVSALLYPTEIEERVRTAITNLIPVELTLENFGIPRLYGIGNIESLRKLHMLFREFRILDTARHMLIGGIEGNTTQILLNKQVALVGKVNFPVGEETLGSIHIEITSEDEDELMTIIDWLAPQTVEGEAIMEIDL